jgi:hypothetical protein
VEEQRSITRYARASASGSAWTMRPQEAGGHLATANGLSVRRDAEQIATGSQCVGCAPPMAVTATDDNRQGNPANSVLRNSHWVSDCPQVVRNEMKYIYLVRPLRGAWIHSGGRVEGEGPRLSRPARHPLDPLQPAATAIRGTAFQE